MKSHILSVPYVLCMSDFATSTAETGYRIPTLYLSALPVLYHLRIVGGCVVALVIAITAYAKTTNRYMMYIVGFSALVK